MRVARIGEKIKVKGLDLYTDTICTITSVGLCTILARPYRSRDVISVDEDDIIFLEPETFTGKEKRALLTRLIGDFKLETKDFIAEMGMLNKLLKQFPDCEFWRDYKGLDGAYSMRLYMTADVMAQIKQEYNKINLEFEPKVHSIGDKKLGEDIVIEKFKLE